MGLENIKIYFLFAVKPDFKFIFCVNSRSDCVKPVASFKELCISEEMLLSFSNDTVTSAKFLGGDVISFTEVY